ncbi:MAG: glucose-6-phosphate dehydrogenase [Anaerolineae bacterium]
MIRAMIFDLDGTLVQTERLKAISYARAVTELRPDAVTEDAVMSAFRDVVGLSRNEVATALVERFGLAQAAAARMAEFSVSTPWQAYIQLRLRHYEALLADPEVLDERQIYRINHYLGKETVQNILVSRFANTIYEPLWNRNYVDHVQITVAETVGVGSRAGYYDGVGAVRDMFQNHILQLLSLVAMEAPASFDAEAQREEKVKVLKAVRPIRADEVARNAVRAQYRGYRDEPGVAPDSQTETYAAIRFHIDNWRWQGVPFYLRSGKRLATKASEITIQFKRPPHLMFPLPAGAEIAPNLLTLCLQPDEGIHLRTQAKVPDTVADMHTVSLAFHYRDSFEANPIPEAYERLLLDALHGDASLFTRGDRAELAWRLLDPILAAWQAGKAPLATYEPGSWGPAEADELLARDGRAWLHGCAH